MNKIGIIMIAFIIMLSGIGIVNAITLETDASVIPTPTPSSEKSISVDKASIDFGRLYTGNDSTIAITVKNNGTVNTGVQISASSMIAKNIACAQVIGIDCPPKIPSSSITVNGISLDKPITIIESLEAGNSQTIYVKLNIPSNAQAADYAGSITILPI